MARSHTGGPLEQAAAEAVRHYVDGVKAGRAPGSAASRRAAERRLERIADALRDATPMQELKLVQERHDLEDRVTWYDQEDAFVEVVRPYSKRHGIAFDTWREIGVPAAVLRRAGIRPVRRREAG